MRRYDISLMDLPNGDKSLVFTRSTRHMDNLVDLLALSKAITERIWRLENGPAGHRAMASIRRNQEARQKEAVMKEFSDFVSKRLEEWFHDRYGYLKSPPERTISQNGNEPS